MSLAFIYKRLLNGFALGYSIGEIFRIVLFRKLFSRINNSNVVKIESFLHLELPDLSIMVISLEDREDRRDLIKRSLSINGLPFRFIDGVHGKTLKKNDIKMYFSSTSTKYLTNGSIGCILSHVKTYNYILESNIEFSLILEDDVILSDEFHSKLKQLMFTIPEDFDIIYLASNFSSRNNLSNWVSDMVYIPLYPRSGQYAYLISKNGAKKIMNNIFPVRITLGGIDTIIGRMVSKKKLNAYHVIQNLCEVEYNNVSNILNQSRGNKVIHQTEYYE